MGKNKNRGDNEGNRFCKKSMAINIKDSFNISMYKEMNRVTDEQKCGSQNTLFNALDFIDRKKICNRNARAL
jgi:hypothetical protein